MPLLFSYGTLRDVTVQQAHFGRVLTGHPDRLLGYRVTLLEISNPEVVAVSGSKHHPIVVPSNDLTDTVDGMVFEVTDEELVKADSYEVEAYHRILASLASGDMAWVYVKR